MSEIIGKMGEQGQMNGYQFLLYSIINSQRTGVPSVYLRERM